MRKIVIPLLLTASLLMTVGCSRNVFVNQGNGVGIPLEAVREQHKDQNRSPHFATDAVPDVKSETN